ncbi:MAG: M20 family metallo-hydrolase [Bacteroidaceae bacterium]|nr:M20 family metallo-hydrolase [Bacteroidaceae bacterium]MBR5276418.1 M20 family metallo-hydrolase [Bacteroidaceae bacterium]MBR5890717.1 M20 family metallo-hydrolase [Bacteroidaceae bacterium]
MDFSKSDIEQAVGLLKILVSTPSISRDESAAADRLQSYIERSAPFPGAMHRHLNNIWCIAPGYDASRPTILLDAHIDTVKPVAAWTKSPFTPVIEDDCLYGLGSNDDGASLVSMLHVFYKLCGTQQSYNLIFLASAEEEVSGKDGIEAVLPMLPPISCAIIGEPTGMHPAIAEKGLMVLDCTAHGKSGHAARNEGINAIYEALPDVEWFRTFSFPKVSPLLGPVKMSVTQINAGTQHNVVPDGCKYVVDVRSNECYSNKEIVDIVAANVKSEVKPRSLRLNSSSIELEHPLVKRAVELGRKPFGSPTLSNQALISNVPCLKMGPGESSRSHTANEFIKLSEIREGMELYFKMLDGLKL